MAFLQQGAPNFNFYFLVLTLTQASSSITHILATVTMSHQFRPCRVCQTLTELRCQNCNIEAYCSVDCHERGWPLHHIDCVPSLTSPPHGALCVKKETIVGLVFLAGRSEYQRCEVLVNTYVLSSNSGARLSCWSKRISTMRGIGQYLRTLFESVSVIPNVRPRTQPWGPPGARTLS
ncbi:hypothetical protein RSAG8_07438, partial [Rhizoctonia solani AG-8 WAC10335]